MNLLVIGDPHAHPSYDNSRFTKLGNFIAREKPQIIVCIGDMADMPSLSSYDKGTKGFEGRRYKKDVESVIDAQKKLFAPIKKFEDISQSFICVWETMKIVLLGLLILHQN